MPELKDSEGRRALKVLLVDDDPIVLESVGELLEQHGHQVHRRERALGTTSWILRERPDLVVIDVNMPGIGGDAIVEVTRERMRSETPSFVLLSSMSGTQLQALVERLGALGFMRKDDSQQALLARFDELAARHRRQSSSTARRA
jgi:DNA-binding response OmpR family regulator